MTILDWVTGSHGRRLPNLLKEHDRSLEHRSHKRILRQALRLKTQHDLSDEAPEPAERITLESAAGEFPAIRVDVDGMTLYVPELADRNDSLFERVVKHRSWPVDTLGHLLPFAHGDIMLDIGANIGTTSLPRALFGIFQHIHAFEPEPRNFTCLSKSIAANGLENRITAWPYAIGAEGGEAALLLRRGIGRHSLVAETTKPSIPVQVLRLDEWIHQEEIDRDAISFVKVDTQGFEPFVLAGARRLLEARKAVWQLELAPSCLRSTGADIEQFRDLLERYFSYFIDLRQPELGLQPTRSVVDTLAQLTRSHTDIVVFAGF
jgi:FkbM family methyltransferase